MKRCPKCNRTMIFEIMYGWWCVDCDSGEKERVDKTEETS